MIKLEIKKNAYYDSVTLMLISKELKKLDGVSEALVGMGTDLNKEIAQNIGVSTPELANAVSAEPRMSIIYGAAMLSGIIDGLSLPVLMAVTPGLAGIDLPDGPAFAVITVGIHGREGADTASRRPGARGQAIAHGHALAALDQGEDIHAAHADAVDRLH